MTAGSEPRNHDAQLSMVADAFHAARQKGAVDDWACYLDAVPEHLRRAALVELVIIDLEYRWREGENPCIEEYIHRFPLLGPQEAVPDELILEEVRCRRQAGQAVALQDIAQRFPLQFPRIRPTLERWQSLLTVPGFSPAAGADSDPSISAEESDATIANQYEMIRLLGRGASGEVCLAGPQEKQRYRKSHQNSSLYTGAFRESSGAPRPGVGQKPPLSLFAGHGGFLDL